MNRPTVGRLQIATINQSIHVGMPLRSR